jgi:chloramphenicol 3-O-phosphotransferase
MKNFIQLTILFIGIMHSVSATSIVILNGTTCAGKTATAKALTQLLREDGKHVEYFSIDDLLTSWDLPIHDGFKKIAYAIGLGANSIFADTLCQEIISLAQNTDNDFIVVDHCLRSDEMFCDTLLRLNRFNVFFVKVYCSYEKAKERLKQRNLIPGPSNRLPKLVDLHFKIKNKFPHLPADLFPTIHDNKVYDLEIDTTNKTPEICAFSIYYNILKTTPQAFLSQLLDDYWTQKIQAFYTPEITERLQTTK